jgi:hypothetical protein
MELGSESLKESSLSCRSVLLRSNLVLEFAACHVRVQPVEKACLVITCFANYFTHWDV